MTLTEQRIGELWDEAVGEGWTLDHRHVVNFVRRVEREIASTYGVSDDACRAEGQSSASHRVELMKARYRTP